MAAPADAGEPATALRAGASTPAHQRVERLLVAVGVTALGLGERLEPVGDFTEALFPGDLRHAGVHVGVLVGFAGDRCGEILTR